jgi:hypothetical protein
VQQHLVWLVPAGRHNRYFSDMQNVYMRQLFDEMPLDDQCA